MDNTVPAGAALLLAFIYETETGKKAPACYDVIFGNRQSKLSRPLTTLTLAEVQSAQKTWATKAWAKQFGSSAASSAAGAAQFMRATLQGLIAELKLSTSQTLNADLQDRLAYHLLKRRGYAAFMAGKIDATEFGKRLAMEWASFPVLADTRGGSRQVKRGQSYYAGDGLNKVLVKPEAVEAVLAQVRRAGAFPDPLPEMPVDVPEPAPPLPSASINWPAIIILALIALAVAGAFFFRIF